MLKLIRKVRFLFLFLITLLFCLITAFNAEMGFIKLSNFVFAILFVTSLVVIGEKEEKLLFWLIVLGIIHLLHCLLRIWVDHVVLKAGEVFFGMCFFLLLAVICLRLTLKDKTISITTLFGSLSSYLFIGLAFAYFYLIVYLLYPNTFSGLEPYVEVRMIYFSFVTFTTVGFESVKALSPMMQTVAWIEAFCGQAYMAVFISQLVGRYAADQMKKINK